MANLFAQEIEAYGGTILKNNLVKEFRYDEINNKYSLITNNAKLSESDLIIAARIIIIVSKKFREGKNIKPSNLIGELFLID